MRYLALVALLGFAMAFAVGCKTEAPPAEPPTAKETKEMKEAVEGAKETLKESTEKAADVLKEGTEKATEKLEEATEK